MAGCLDLRTVVEVAGCSACPDSSVVGTARRPPWQRIMGRLLGLNYRWLPGIEIVLEDEARIPDEPVLFAMNHTDRQLFFPSSTRSGSATTLHRDLGQGQVLRASLHGLVHRACCSFRRSRAAT
ncbi:MAG: hypothetical protein R3E53_16975 [Myxococcota bacterium]